MRARLIGAVLGVGLAAACTPTERDDIPDRGTVERPDRPPPPPDPSDPVPPPPPDRPVVEVTPPVQDEGCFRRPVTTPLTYSPNGSVTADINADAVLDFVTFSDELIDDQFVVNIETYLGDRTGHFRHASSVPYAKGGLGIAFDYLDDDRHLDMVTGDHRTRSFTEWMGDGEGGFRPSYARNIGSSPHTPHLVDLNGDGRRDLVIPRYRMIEIYLSKGAGNYRPMPWIKVAKSKNIATPEGISLADLDADGNVDLIAPLSDDNALTVYMGRGNGKFRKHSRFENPCVSPQDSAVGHFDDDGHLDVAIGCGGKEIVVYGGDGTGLLGVRQRYEPPGYLVDLIAADATGDGRLDLIASGYAHDPGDHARFREDYKGYVAVFSRGAEGMSEWDRSLVGMHYTHGLRVDDVDEDGLLDILFAGGGGMPGSHLGVLFGQACDQRE